MSFSTLIPKREIEDIIFLGAGASAADGAPTQKNLLKTFIELFHDKINMNNDQEDRLAPRREEKAIYKRLKTYFLDFFGVDISCTTTTDSYYPTFEECLGFLELAINRDESFKGYQLRDLHQLKNDLIFLISITLKKSLEVPNLYHRKLVKRLDNEDILYRTAFITTNYDLLIDNALLNHLIDAFQEEGYQKRLDYNINFINWEKADYDHSIPLFKLHGSLNWLHCPSCNTLYVTPFRKRAATLAILPIPCQTCSTLLSSIIIPPSYFKVMSNFFLLNLWHNAKLILRDTKRIIFCGYSFPDADLHVKYLLKRAEVNYGLKIEVYIINRTHKEDEKNRYSRFFRENDRVYYNPIENFETFCEKGL